MIYTPPDGAAVSFNFEFTPPYVIPPGDVIVLDFSDSSSVLSFWHYLMAIAPQ